MKLDKDTVVKHQFWFLLGTYVLVWIIAVFWLKFTASDPIDKAKKIYTDADTELKAASRSPKNPNTFCPPWQEYGKVFDKHKQVIWAKVWDLQKDMYDWPAELRNSKDMSTPHTELSQDERERYKGQFYPDQVKNLKTFVEGDAKKGYAGLLGPVELAGGFDNIFKPQKLDETPTREECWLTQEDYWVKRELFIDVSKAMAFQAYLYPIPIDKKEPMPKDVLYRYRYRNQNWEITLHIKQNKEKGLVIAGDSTIKNVQLSQHAQTLTSAKGAGIVFNVFQNPLATAFEVRGEPVAWGAEQKFSAEDYKPLGIDWAKAKENPIALSQAFDWSTCPIRRIEAMAIGQQSCRTYTTPLQPNETLVKLDAPKEDPADANKEKEAPTGGMMGMAGGAAGMMGMAGGPPPTGSAGLALPGQKGATTGNPTPNNAIERNRYLQAPKKDNTEAEKPSRHLPLAIQLLVDQSHMPDVLVALANSRLRVQITQIEFHRVKDIKQADADKNGGGMQLLRTGYMPMGMGGMMSPGGGRGSMPGMGSGMVPPTGGRGMMPPGGGGMMPPGGGRGPMSSPMPGMGSGMAPPAGGSRGPMPGMMGMPGQFGGVKPFMPSSIMTPSGMPPRSPAGGPMPTTGDPKDKKTQGDENLVSITVYGVATLYRRPDPPKTDPSADQSGQPAPSVPATAPAPGGTGR